MIYNPQHSRLDQLVGQSFAGSQTVPARSQGEVTSAFAGGGGKTPSYSLGLIIPPGFDASLERGEHPFGVNLST